MPILRNTLRRLRTALGNHAAKRRMYAELESCDPHTLKDIGLRWERGKLVPLNPESQRPDIAYRKTEESAETPDVCPRCGTRLT
ncbi:DUF1127 domain-containing protein [Aidingimonas halophila]|uniref:YjiS-like domain-containing protein n=1 Tax=Aidingimonas halophila TaxID=574349 RepID=A0A1H2ZC01_9GAMM|nr:DUF1127 domain-containing protein [Aidingimonas halophila]GHC15739.1 hypothetical protein GCM10008094_00930 [Aidingimonas halophila]SDX14921.1 protein of unknown function [Aidingimonas halophila]